MRRTSLAIALVCLAFAVALTFSFNRPQPVAASALRPDFTEALMFGSADALLLSCMDYRLTDETADFMSHELRMHDNYDHVILAGASLGVTNTKYPNWGKTFWEHLDAAIALHGVHEVIIMDHRNCGAYKLFLNKEFKADAKGEELKQETATHKEQLDALAKTIHEKYPTMDVLTLIMNLDGHVEHIGEIKGTPAKGGEKH